jgi:hypothetical protein
MDAARSIAIAGIEPFHLRIIFGQSASSQASNFCIPLAAGRLSGAHRSIHLLECLALGAQVGPSIKIRRFKTRMTEKVSDRDDIDA